MVGLIPNQNHKVLSANQSVFSQAQGTATTRGAPCDGLADDG